MKTKHGFLFGIAVLLVAAMFTFTLAGCGDGAGGGSPDPDPDPGPGPGPGPSKGVDATISLADLGNNSFTLTLTGATWKADGDDPRLGMATINYTTLDRGNYIHSVNVSGDSGILHWVNEEGVLLYVNVTVARTSDTVLTITAVKDTSLDNNRDPANTGSGAITLWDNTHWAEEMSGIESRTWGAYFLFNWTNEGKRESDGNYSATYFGTLTVAEDSATSVPITIN